MTRQQFNSLLGDNTFRAGAFIIAIATLVSLGGAIIRPDSSPHANSQYLELSALEPMAKIVFLKLERHEEADDDGREGGYFTGWRQPYYHIPIDSFGITGNIVHYRKYGSIEISTITLEEVFFPAESGQQHSGRIIAEKGERGVSRYKADSLAAEFEKKCIESRTFILGTDKYGRDLLSRLMAGTGVSLGVGLISVLISVLIGTLLGLMAGYFRGRTDSIILWFINVIWSIPTLLLVLSISLVLGKGLWQIFIAVGLSMWVEVARVVRGQVLSLREKEFIEAGRVLGFSHSRIIFRHILPNAISPVIVISAANFATAILLEAGLSFLGLGAQPPVATWGRMITEHKASIITGDAHLAIIPGIAIMLLVLSFSLTGNALRDALDEKVIPLA